jgi:hypothetical protein
MGLKVKTHSDLCSPRTPETEEKHIGVEIEFLSPLGEAELGRILLESNIADYVTLKGDGSIRELCTGDCVRGKICGCDCRGHELCVLAPQKKFKSIITQVCRLLTDAQAIVNSTCGLHVHIDMRSRDKEKSFNNLVRIQDLLYGVCDSSRRRSIYCSPVSRPSLPKDLEVINRYRSINARSLLSHRTLEVRVHHGTVKTKDIKCWVDLLVRAVDAGFINEDVRTERALSRKVRLTKELKSYVQGRLRKYSETG